MYLLATPSIPDAVFPVACSSIDDPSVGWPLVYRNVTRWQDALELLPAGERDVSANRLQPVDPFLRDAGHMCDHPAPFPHDARGIGVGGLEAHDLELEIGRSARRRVAAAERMDLGAPAGGGDALGGGDERAGRGRSR